MIVNSIGLPTHDLIRMEFESNEDLSGKKEKADLAFFIEENH